ncbi:MAG: hypothetical protein QOJ13_564 [Gaiellales bacterium]|jgi:hypothetical protein|nr:hypothetical protein [Gaiellales bacterium]MDX6591368.1 hypothetical protein [Gaiellales bacterium]
MDTVTESIEEARRLLEQGKQRKASEILTLAAYDTQDTSKLAIIRSLALQGKEREGRFTRGRWDEAIRVSEKRLEAQPLA